MTDLELSESKDPWSQLAEENGNEYSLFIEYCKLGPRRNRKMLAVTGIAEITSIDTYSRRHKWNVRAKAYDSACNNLVPTETALSPTETLAFQHAVGTAMLKLGIQAIQLKNPSTIKMGDAIKLTAMGAELQRKAQGTDQSGIQIHFNGKSVDALNEILEELDMLEIEVEDEALDEGLGPA